MEQFTKVNGMMTKNRGKGNRHGVSQQKTNISKMMVMFMKETGNLIIDTEKGKCLIVGDQISNFFLT